MSRCGLPGIHRRRCRHRPAGLTLLELLLSIGLILIVMVSLAQFYSQCMDARERGRNISARAQLIRNVMDRITSEIRRVTPYRAMGDPIEGDNIRMSFFTTTTPEARAFRGAAYTGEVPVASSDLEWVQYYIRVDLETLDDAGNPLVLGLYRRSIRSAAFTNPVVPVQPSSDESSPSGDDGEAGDGTGANGEGQADASGGASGIGGGAENAANAENDASAAEVVEEEQAPAYEVVDQIVSEQIKYLRVRYTNGTGWLDEWTAGSDPLKAMMQGQQTGRFTVAGLPQAVEITLGFEPDFDLLLPKEETDTTEEEEETGPIEYDASRTASTADDTEPHPDRFTTVVNLPLAEKVFSPLAGKLQNEANKFGGQRLQEFMNSGPSFGDFDAGSFGSGSRGGRSSGSGRSGPAQGLFGGRSDEGGQ